MRYYEVWLDDDDLAEYGDDVVIALMRHMPGVFDAIAEGAARVVVNEHGLRKLRAILGGFQNGYIDVQPVSQREYAAYRRSQIENLAWRNHQ